jgi:NDP-sugar pyrophosphorylase family protein
MNAAALAGVSPDRPSESVRELYPTLLADRPGSVRVCRTNAEFFDIGTPADYLATVRRMAAPDTGPLDRGRDCSIDDSADVTDSVLWDRVRIGPSAVVASCVVGDDVEIPAGARFARSALVRRGASLRVTPLS